MCLFAAFVNVCSGDETQGLTCASHVLYHILSPQCTVEVVLVILFALSFLMNFRISWSPSTKKATGVSIRAGLNPDQSGAKQQLHSVENKDGIGAAPSDWVGNST